MRVWPLTRLRALPARAPRPRLCLFHRHPRVPAQAASATEEIEAKQEELLQQLKREQQKKLSLDDETLDCARDVRVLRQRRKLAEDEAVSSWKKVDEVVRERQALERTVAELRMQQEVRGLGDGALGELKAAVRASRLRFSRQRARHPDVFRFLDQD